MRAACPHLTVASSILNQDTASVDYIDKPVQAPHVSDSDLLRSVAGGDESALAELYQRYHVDIYNYLLRLIHDRRVAEDLLQEVFVAVWQGAARFRGRSSVKNWVFRIAHNQAVNWLRRLSRLPLESDLKDLGSDFDVESLSLRHWRAKQVHEALDELTPNHRAVVELAFVHGLSYAEIAEVVGCPLGTVKSRMSYALRYLGGLLRGQGLE